MAQFEPPRCPGLSKPASTASLVAAETTPLLAGEPPSERRVVVDGKEDLTGTSNGYAFKPGDPNNPREWSPAFKWGIVALLAATGFMVYVHPTERKEVQQTS
jgi:hypothetical protein